MSKEHVIIKISKGKKLIPHLIHNLETEQNVIIYFAIFILNFGWQGRGGRLKWGSIQEQSFYIPLSKSKEKGKYEKELQEKRLT